MPVAFLTGTALLGRVEPLALSEKPASYTVS
jgi:hypothetical protein